MVEAFPNNFDICRIFSILPVSPRNHIQMSIRNVEILYSKMHHYTQVIETTHLLQIN